MGKPKTYTEEEIAHYRKMYIDDKMSAAKMAIEMGCSTSAIIRRLKKCGIEARSMVDAADVREGNEIRPDSLTRRRSKKRRKNYVGPIKTTEEREMEAEDKITQMIARHEGG